MQVLVMLFFFGVAGMVALVILEGRGETAMSVACFVGTVFIFYIVGHGAFNQGVLAGRTLNSSHNYLVKVKKQSELGIPLLVYDMVDKKDRVIDLDVYPPSEFSEVIMADGKIMLLPK